LNLIVPPRPKISKAKALVIKIRLFNQTVRGIAEKRHSIKKYFKKHLEFQLRLKLQILKFNFCDNFK